MIQERPLPGKSGSSQGTVVNMSILLSENNPLGVCQMAALAAHKLLLLLQMYVSPHEPNCLLVTEVRCRSPCAVCEH